MFAHALPAWEKCPGVSYQTLDRFHKHITTGPPLPPGGFAVRRAEKKELNPTYTLPPPRQCLLLLSDQKLDLWTIHSYIQS